MRAADHAKKPGGGAPAAAHAAPHPGKGTQVARAGAHAASLPRVQLHNISSGHGHQVNGGAENVDPSAVNPHPGFDHNRIGQRGGAPFHTIHATHLYQNDGSVGGYGRLIPSGAAVWINAGAITKLICKDPDGKLPLRPLECVYVFEYEHNGGVFPAGSWMPASAVPHLVSVEEHAIAKRIARERGDAHHHFGHGIEIVKSASAERDNVLDLYTYPRQRGVANKAKYYYNDLALNLPFTGGERVGVLTDNIPGPDPTFHGLDPYREFYPEEPHHEASIPLYAKEASHPSGRQMHFVYGYVKNDAGAKIHGWINKSCLPHGFDRHK